jgi:hypothetical protein
MKRGKSKEHSRETEMSAEEYWEKQLGFKIDPWHGISGSKFKDHLAAPGTISVDWNTCEELLRMAVRMYLELPEQYSPIILRHLNNVSLGFFYRPYHRIPCEVSKCHIRPLDETLGTEQPSRPSWFNLRADRLLFPMRHTGYIWCRVTLRFLLIAGPRPPTFGKCYGTRCLNNAFLWQIRRLITNKQARKGSLMILLHLTLSPRPPFSTKGKLWANRLLCALFDRLCLVSSRAESFKLWPVPARLFSRPLP